MNKSDDEARRLKEKDNEVKCFIMMLSCHWCPEQGYSFRRLACYSGEQTVVSTLSTVFSKVRRDGVMRGLEATESDSYCYSCVAGLGRRRRWDSRDKSHTVNPGLLGKMMFSIWSRPDMTR